MTVVDADAIGGTVTAAPRINALQKLWLREIGIEKTWLQVADSVPVPVSVSQVGIADATGHGLVHAGALVASSLAGLSSEHRPAIAPIDREPSVAIPKRQSAVALAPVVLMANPQVDAVIPAASFDALCEQVQSCTACGLSRGRRHAVFGMGARPARWMIIGEAPGEQEDRQGLPFVGRSGELLNAMLSAVGMSREKDVFIANVIKCRPPGNRNPKVDEIAACSPYLMRQIELVQPERILVLGRFAAQALLGTSATIGSLRGRLHEWTSESGCRIPIVVSYHPAYLLRSPVEKARAWQDLQLALA